MTTPKVIRNYKIIVSQVLRYWLMSLTCQAMTLTLAPLNVLQCITLFNVWRGTEFSS